MFEIKSRMLKKIFTIIMIAGLSIIIMSCETERTMPESQHNGETLELEMAVLEEEISSLRNMNVILETENIRLERENNRLDRDNIDLRSEVVSIRSDILSLERQVERLEAANEHRAGIYSIASVIVSAMSGFAFSLILTRIKGKRRKKREEISDSESSEDESDGGDEGEDSDEVDPEGILRIGRFKN